MAPNEAPIKTIRILCFGDSLTAGYCYDGAVHAPYNEKLQQMVEMAFPEYAIETEEDGRDGDLVTSKVGFVRRINEQFASDSSQSYNWTVVLGGTNDLAHGVSAEALFEDLKRVWDVPLSHKSKVLALTIPEAGVTGARGRKINETRREVNDLIKGYKRENLHVFDLCAAVPYHSMSETDRGKYWDDGLHFTPDGYELVGQKVGMALVSLLVKDKFKGQTPAKRKRNFADDDAMFEEEGGDPHSLTTGYIVVRWKDLE